MLPLYSDKDDPSAKKRRPKKRTYVPLVAITAICFFSIVIFVSTKTTSEPAKLARPQSATSATSGPRAFPRVPIPPKLERVMNSPVRSFEFGERAGERGRERYRAEELKIIAGERSERRSSLSSRRVLGNQSIYSIYSIYST